MAKLTLISLLFIALFSLTSAYSKPKSTNFRVYLQGHFNTTQPIQYGDVFGVEEILTVGSDPNSEFLGYVQGSIAFSNSRGTLFDIHVSLTYVFLGGEYNGSSVSVVGKNDLTIAYREFPIVGGTGVFKLARGTVVGTTFSENPPIYIYDLEVVQDQ